MCKRILSVIFIFFTILCNAQKVENCIAIESTVQKLQDSLRNVFVVEDLEPFSIRRYDYFEEKFKNDLSSKILKKAYSISKTKRSFKLNECFSKSLLISNHSADSLRAKNKYPTGIDRNLDDSLNKVLNEIFAIQGKAERETKYNAFISSEAYKTVKAQTEAATNRIILIGQPIIVDNKYIFFTLFLSDKSRDYYSSIYLYKKEGVNWVLVREDNW
jgi:hypothetical protein